MVLRRDTRGDLRTVDGCCDMTIQREHYHLSRHGLLGGRPFQQTESDQDPVQITMSIKLSTDAHVICCR